ncbi:hypothetical protein CASFOL_029095 [Castilleja foliolosa]|uniref:Dof zinc finger protein n=1 Tax=Castilleja foliolosa TaxID=1961234 RepID=A0ABD3CDW3_9LAMI
MGLSTKQVSGDNPQGFDWPSELPNPPAAAKRPLQQQPEPPVKCPRCSSTNTKFCYYNNYNKSQPRHFCKSCKRHWTKGGTLRNVPVGGSGRKNKRPRISNAPNFPMNANTGNNQKSMPNIIYQALIHNNNNNNNNSSSGGDTSATGDGKTEYDEFWSLSNNNYLDMNNNPIYYQYSLNEFDHNHYPENYIAGSSSEPWPGPDTALDLPNYWNWSEIDVLTSSSGGISVVSWGDDDPEIKP